MPKAGKTAPPQDSAILAGMHHASVEKNSRLRLPSLWPDLKPGDELWLLSWPSSSGSDKCIKAFPRAGIKRLQNKINSLPVSDPAVLHPRRLIGGQSMTVTISPRRKITIPRHFLQHAGIKTEALLVGELDSFSIWNPQNPPASGFHDLRLAFSVID